MTKPDLKSSFIYRGKTYYIDWFDINDDNIPDLPWQQVYVLGDVNGLVPIVHYQNNDDNLPGGRLEPGESLESALEREIDEEIKAKVVSWHPLGYQSGVNDDGNTVYQLRVYAKLIIDEVFKGDPGGSVIGHSLVPLRDLNEYIKWGVVGDRLIDMVAKRGLMH